MRRGIALGLFALVLVIGSFLAFTSPPRLLSLYDRARGGTAGAQQVAEGAAFGSHGQTLDIWVPERAGGAARPVVIFWYGGGWAKGDRTSYAFAGRALARAGFVVVIPDYRKVPQVHFPAFLDDGAEAVAWVEDNIAQFGGDPERLAFMGHSAGAYEAIMLALDSKRLVAVGADPANVKAAVGLSGPYDFYPFDSPRSIAAFSEWPQPEATQPITFARADAPPLLLVTSDGDETVRPRNANNLGATLRELGAPVEVKNYGPLDHEEIVMALSVPFRSKGPVLADSVAFLKARMGE
ncbi:alpha/beta hydrolase fold domain-containing protein [Porphyrobacter sp. SLTP]|uniref:alpha/beta hydrolase n=1 Tax=Porphyrobacter sp. SLTP TaxID=2683266 RepID=UPI0014122166|nr:alpha/beta hydrolase [Porphyrobacter sp. SLTP]NBB25524.1 alpha/beta hydrolase fold domain-containing protein [Porphyrobacter sp. SLTP]